VRVLVTGARGFIGRNLVAELKTLPDIGVDEFDLDTDPDQFDGLCGRCGFVFHLAGVNRPPSPDAYMLGNAGPAEALARALEKNGNACPIVLASSTQAGLDNPYGRSKLAAEAVLAEHGRRAGAAVWIYRLPNVFGKWCRPDYNSAVATFCHRLARDLPIRIDDPATELSLVYIDDVFREFIGRLERTRTGEGAPAADDGFPGVRPVHRITVGDLAARIASFRDGRAARTLPDLADDLTRKLHATYLSDLPADRIRIPLDTRADGRGSFTELLKSRAGGQVSVNVIRPGAFKGQHWHHTKCEKFIAVSGRGAVRLRRIDGGEVAEYPIAGERLEIIDIPPGSTHSIENRGDADLIVVMWADEPFDPGRPDTHPMDV